MNNQENQINGEKKIKIMVDSVSFDHKPSTTNGEVQAIQNRLKNSSTIREVTVTQLYDYLLKGYTVRPGVLKDGASIQNFLQQQTIFLDIDNKEGKTVITLDSVLAKLKEVNLNPCFYHNTFNYTEEYPRIRIVFILDEPVTNLGLITRALEILNNYIPNADTSCANPGKLMFGTNKGGCMLNKNATISIDDIIALNQKTDKSSYKKNTALNKMIRDFDLLNYVSQEYGSPVSRGSNYYAFDDCPICGTHGCFRIYDDNTFYCFDPKGLTGGTIIEYLMATKKMSKSESINYFKYEIMGLSKEDDDSGEKYRDNLEQKIKKLPIQITLPEKINWIMKTKHGVDINPAILSKFILSQIYFFIIKSYVDKNTVKYLYSDNVYKECSDMELKKIIEALMPDGLESREGIEKTLYLLCVKAKYLKMKDVNDNEDIINFKNGIYHFSTDSLEPHSPKYYVTIQIDANYIKDLESPPTHYYDNFMKDFTTSEMDKQQVLEEFSGLTISSIDASRIKSVLILVGEGHTGKSKYISLHENLVGEGNFTSTEIKKMDSNFSKINLLNKRLASFSDVTSLKLPNLDFLKKMTGGDSLNDARKYQDAIDFTFKGVAMMSMNQFMKFGGDAGPHVWDRFVIVETPNAIPPEKRDKDLLKHLLEEKDYIVSRAIKAVRKVIENNYTLSIPESSIKSREYFRIEHDSLARFIKECTERVIREPEIDDPTTGQFYQIYKNWCKDNNNNFTEDYQNFRKALLAETKETLVKKTFGGNTYFRYIIPSDEIKNTYGTEMGLFKKRY